MFRSQTNCKSHYKVTCTCQASLLFCSVGFEGIFLTCKPVCRGRSFQEGFVRNLGPPVSAVGQVAHSYCCCTLLVKLHFVFEGGLHFRAPHKILGAIYHSQGPCVMTHTIDSFSHPILRAIHHSAIPGDLHMLTFWSQKQYTVGI